MMHTIKTYIKKLLRWLGIYNRVKSSCIYNLYWKYVDPNIVDRQRKEIEFYHDLLGNSFKPGCLIFDVGANQGSKTEVFLKMGARVISIEPDEYNQEVLRQRFHNFRLFQKPVTIIGKAVSNKNSIQRMWIEEQGSAKNTLSYKWVETLRADKSRFGKQLRFKSEREVETITLDYLIETIGKPCFIKIDVEGYEIMVLRGLNQTVKYLSFEINLPEFRKEGLECIKWLYGISSDGKFNYVIDCCEGLVLKEWMEYQDFIDILKNCIVSGIEVIWKVPTIDY